MLHEREHNQADADYTRAEVIKVKYIKEIKQCEQLEVYH